MQISCQIAFSSLGDPFRSLVDKLWSAGNNATAVQPVPMADTLLSTHVAGVGLRHCTRTARVAGQVSTQQILQEDVRSLSTSFALRSQPRPLGSTIADLAYIHAKARSCAGSAGWVGWNDLLLETAMQRQSVAPWLDLSLSSVNET